MATRQDLFRYVLDRCRAGGLQEELSEALNQCVTRSQETGKQSEITLKIKIKPNGTTGQYHITDDVRIRLPTLEKGASIFFGTPDGNLQRNDPAQRQLDLESVPNRRPQTFEKTI